MATVQIIREQRVWIDRARSYEILVDGEVVGTVANGEGKKFQLDEGEHSIQARIDWCSSPAILVDVRSDLKIRCGCNANPATGLFYAIANRANYLWISQDGE